MQRWSNTSDVVSPSRWRSLAVAIVLVACAVMLFLARCDTDNAPADLKQAASVIRYELRPKNLSRSAFTVAFPNGKPSDWIDYRNSTLGAAERTYSEEEAENDPQIREQAKSVKMPLLPKGVQIRAWEVDKDAGRQIVLRSDNAGGKVIVEGYTDPTQPPVLKRAYTLPRVDPAPGVRETYEANQAEGATGQGNPGL
jgi:hypothetical protein